MQEDIEHRSVTLVIKGAKLTEQTLKSAIKKLLTPSKSRRSTTSKTTTKTTYGKQTV